MVEVSRVDLRRAEIFQVVKGAKLCSNLYRREKQLKRLAGKLHARSKRIERELLTERKRGSGLAVVQYHSGAGGLRCNERDSGSKRLQREVRHDAKPCKEAWPRCIESCRL